MVAKIADWYVEKGYGEAHPLDQVSCKELPEHLQKEVEKLRGLTVADLSSSAGHADTHGCIFDALLAQFPERERTVLLERVIMPRPTTLAVLGERFGVSHQRIAQIEKEVREHIGILTAPGTSVRERLKTMVDSLPRLVPLTVDGDSIAQTHDLLAPVTDTGLPVWVFLNALCDEVEVSDGWLGIPNLDLDVAVTHARLAEQAIVPGVSRVGADRLQLGFTPAQFDAWLSHCGYKRYLSFAVRPAERVADAVVQVLTMAEGALTVPEIMRVLSELGVARSITTVTAALRSDDRVRREDDAWRLRCPRPLRTEVFNRLYTVLDEGQEMDWEELRRTCSDLLISAEELRVIASHGPFETHGDIVRLKDKQEPEVLPPTLCLGLYRVSDGWVHPLRMMSQADKVLSVPLPSAVVEIAELRFGETRDVAEGVSLSWVLPAPCLRISSHAQYKIRPGQRVRLWFGDDGQFRIQEIPPLNVVGTPWAAALSVMGLPSAGNAATDESTVRHAVGVMDEHPIGALVGAYLRKAEFGVLDQLRRLSDVFFDDQDLRYAPQG